jgi:hypothetical protein
VQDVRGSGQEASGGKQGVSRRKESDEQAGLCEYNEHEEQ